VHRDRPSPHGTRAFRGEFDRSEPSGAAASSRDPYGSSRSSTTARARTIRRTREALARSHPANGFLHCAAGLPRRRASIRETSRYSRNGSSPGRRHSSRLFPIRAAEARVGAVARGGVRLSQEPSAAWSGACFAGIASWRGVDRGCMRAGRTSTESARQTSLQEHANPSSGDFQAVILPSPCETDGETPGPSSAVTWKSLAATEAIGAVGALAVGRSRRGTGAHSSLGGPYGYAGGSSLAAVLRTRRIKRRDALHTPSVFSAKSAKASGCTHAAMISSDSTIWAGAINRRSRRPRRHAPASFSAAPRAGRRPPRGAVEPEPAGLHDHDVRLERGEAVAPEVGACSPGRAPAASSGRSPAPHPHAADHHRVDPFDVRTRGLSRTSRRGGRRRRPARGGQRHSRRWLRARCPAHRSGRPRSRRASSGETDDGKSALQTGDRGPDVVEGNRRRCRDPA